MKPISYEDLTALQSGLPPDDPELLELLTVPNAWLDLMKSYCLDQVIASGGSKVKILHGGAATGKSHFLRSLQIYAEHNGYFAVNLDLSQVDFHLTDSMAFYQAIAAELDLDLLEKVVIAKILGKLGYAVADFESFGGVLTDYLREQEGSDFAQAKKEIRNCLNSITNSIELDFSFRKFLHVFMEAAVEKNTHIIQIAQEWIKGEKLERPDRTSSILYESLAKHNARSWFYSLVEIIKFMGYKGVVVCMDQFEAILPKSEAKVLYTTMKRNDCYQFLRQLIDDLDFFRNVLFIISGRSEIVTNEHYGLPSYHALWMRIQPGFSQSAYLNYYADLVDADLIFMDLQKSNLLNQLREQMDNLGVRNTLENTGRYNSDKPEYKNFKDLIRDTIFQ